MTLRKRRKRVKRLGSRTYSGNTKNQRGSGIKGGTGKAGGHKHKFNIRWMDFGGQKAMPAKPKEKAMNLYEIEERKEELLKKGLLEKEGEKIIIDGKKLGIAKVLGLGSLSFEAEFRNVKLSKKTRKKTALEEEDLEFEKVTETEDEGEKGG